MNMRELLDILTEGRDAPLFHFTHDYAFYKNILPNDILKQGTRGGVSLTRDIHTPFYGDRWDRPILLILNQAALSKLYKIVPMYGDSPNISPPIPQQDESEERVMSDIFPLHKYLLAIAVDEYKGEKVELRYVNSATDDGSNVDTVHLADYSSKFNVPIVSRQSVKSNGSWTHDITKIICSNADKIIKRNAKDLKQKPREFYHPVVIDRPHSNHK